VFFTGSSAATSNTSTKEKQGADYGVRDVIGQWLVPQKSVE